MTPKLRIGIVGGCLGSNRSVRLSELYYRILQRRFEARGFGRLSFVLSGYNDPPELLDESRRLVREKGIGVLIVQVRPHPLMRSGWLVWWRSERGRRAGIALHPAMWDRSRIDYDTVKFSYLATHSGWEGGPVRGVPMKAASPLWRRWLSKGNINSLLGWVAGLQRWAVRQHEDIIGAVRDECVAAGVHLIVLGPLAIPLRPAAHRFCRAASRELAAKLAASGVDYVEACSARDAEGQDILLADGQHANARGHARIADLLEAALERALPAEAAAASAPDKIPRRALTR